MFEAYKIGISIGIANMASQGLSALRKDLMATHNVTVSLQQKMNAMKWVGAGAAAAGAGAGILGFMKKSIDASKEYTRQISLMNASGMDHVEVAQSITAAWQTSRSVITSSAQENLAAIRELRSVFGKGEGMQEAYNVLPIVQRTKAIMEALTGKEQHGIAAAMVKTAELRAPGMVTPDVLNRNAEGMSKALMAFGGTLQVQDFLGTMKMSKMAALRLSDDYVYNYMPTLMQEMKTGAGGGGAQTAGTAMMSAYQTIVSGAGIKKSAIPLWEQLGLIKSSDIVGNMGGHMQVKPGSVQGSSIFQTNPEQWAVTVLGPAIANYTAKHPGMNREQVIGSMFGNRNAQFLMNTFIAKSAQFERDKTLIGSTGSSYDTYKKLLQTNPDLASMAMHKQYTNIMAQLGYTILPALLPYMVKFAGALNSLSEWMHIHPRRLKAIAEGMIVVGAGLAVLGTAAMGIGLLKFVGYLKGFSLLPLLRMGVDMGAFAMRIGALGTASTLAAAPIAGVIAALAAAAALPIFHKDVSNWIDRKLHGSDDDAQYARFHNGKNPDGSVNSNASPFIASGGAKTIQVTSITQLDGRTLTKTVSTHQSAAYNRPALSGTGYDISAGFVPASATN